MSDRATGILGGTFDPVHRGHVAIATGVREALGLDSVWFLPCATPPHKPGRTVAAPFERLEMLYLAVEGRRGVGVATDEIARGGMSFTIDTLRAFRERGVAPVFLLGSDALAEIATWRHYEALLEEFDLAVVVRPQEASVPAHARWPEPARGRVIEAPVGPDRPPLGTGGRIVRVPIPPRLVSSSEARARCAAGEPLEDLVPARVARYIQRRRLYRQETSN